MLLVSLAPVFKRVLIANRGEIAVRICQTLQQMGITAVAVYSDPDRGALHVVRADEAYPLDGTTSAETYLRIDKIIDIAHAHRIDAIHPGYGFLSENAEFAQACCDAGITFIGPKPDVIRTVGDKIEAKRAMQGAGVPVVPGWSGDCTGGLAVVQEQAQALGYPILVKAAGGGGGKGMRVVRRADDLESALESAAREARSAFGDDRVFLEKLIDKPRHVEFQIFGDEHGNVVHLFERECSIQRRHQKIIEESPSPALTPELRSKMGAAAVSAAKAVGYTNAGTVEFMLDADGQFYFLEINARLQVEHPVTESVTGRDLVVDQLRIAAGQPLGFTQDDLSQVGHSIECRVYAEDAAHNFMPSTGVIDHYIPPSGRCVRVDSGVTVGSEVSVHYDPMLAKLIVSGRDRDDALDRMRWALERYVVLGVTTNIAFLRRLIEHPRFRTSDIHTQFLEEENIACEPASIPDAAWVAAALASDQVAATSGGQMAGHAAKPSVTGPWNSGGGWRNS